MIGSRHRKPAPRDSHRDHYQEGQHAPDDPRKPDYCRCGKGKTPGRSLGSSEAWIYGPSPVRMQIHVAPLSQKGFRSLRDESGCHAEVITRVGGEFFQHSFIRRPIRNGTDKEDHLTVGLIRELLRFTPSSAPGGSNALSGQILDRVWPWTEIVRQTMARVRKNCRPGRHTTIHAEVWDVCGEHAGRRPDLNYRTDRASPVRTALICAQPFWTEACAWRLS